MNMVSNLARLHLSLDPTDHELGTLSTPIYTTTESEHHKVKGYLGPVFLQYFILYFHNIFLCIFTLTHLRPILWNLGIVLQQALVMEPGQGDGSQTFCAETKWIRGIFVFNEQLCMYAFVNLEKTVVRVSAVYLGFLLPQRSTTIFGSDENQCHKKLETTNKDT